MILFCSPFSSRPAALTRTGTTTAAASSSLSIDTSLSSNDNPFSSRASSSSHCSSRSSDHSPLSPKLQYKEIQKGGDIPLSGLRKPAPVTPPHRGKVMLFSFCCPITYCLLSFPVPRYIAPNACCFVSNHLL